MRGSFIDKIQKNAIMLKEVLMKEPIRWSSPELDDSRKEKWEATHPGRLPHHAFYWAEGFASGDMTPDFLEALPGVFWRDGKTVHLNHDVKFVSDDGPGGDPLLRVATPERLVGSFEAGGKRFVLAVAHILGSKPLYFFPRETDEARLNRARTAMGSPKTVFDVSALAGDEAPVPAAMFRRGTMPPRAPTPSKAPTDPRTALPPSRSPTEAPDPDLFGDIEITPVPAAKPVPPRPAPAPPETPRVPDTPAPAPQPHMLVAASAPERVRHQPAVPEERSDGKSTIWSFLAKFENAVIIGFVLVAAVIGIIAIALSIQ